MHRDDFDNRVIRRLEQQARRLRTYRLIEGLGMVAALLFAALAVQMLLDWSMRLRLDTRALLLLAVIALFGLTVWKFVVSPLRLRFGAYEMASLVEDRFPHLDALLISAVQFHGGQTGDRASNSPELIARVVDRASVEAEALPIKKILNPRRARRSGLGLVVILSAAATVLFLAPEAAGIWFARNILLDDVQWPKRTRIVVEDLDDGILRGAIGDELEIRARIDEHYEVPRQVDITYETRSGKTGTEGMTGVGERGFRLSFPRVREEFKFYLSGGDDTTDWYDTKLSHRPRIETAALSVTPPAYTRIEPYTLPPDQRAVEMYLGSSLSFAITCSKPIAQARLMSGTELITEARPTEQGFAVEVAPLESQTYHFDLLDSDGLRNNRPVRFSARMIKDKSPKVRLNLPNVGNLVSEFAVLDVEAEFTDELGLATAEILYRIAGIELAPQPIPLEGFATYSKSFQSRFEWPVASAGVSVGQQVSVFAQARDFDDVSGPNVGESSTITFRIATLEELQSEFTRREQEYRRQFQRLVESQERLRGDLLTLLARMNDANTRDDLELLLAPLERRQRQILAQGNIIRQQFDQLLTQMGINRMQTAEIAERLEGGIIAPLGQLTTRELPAAADLLRRLSRERTDELARTVDPLQAQIMAKMQLILDNMLRWEGYQEMVTMLREILKLQKELNSETREEIRRQGGEVFDD